MRHQKVSPTSFCLFCAFWAHYITTDTSVAKATIAQTPLLGKSVNVPRTALKQKPVNTKSDAFATPLRRHTTTHKSSASTSHDIFSGIQTPAPMSRRQKVQVYQEPLSETEEALLQKEEEKCDEIEYMPPNTLHCISSFIYEEQSSLLMISNSNEKGH